MTKLDLEEREAECFAMLERLDSSSVKMNALEKKNYIKAKDDLGILPEDSTVPIGYKRCGKCRSVKKFYLYNKNSASKNNVTGTCKECQKSTSTKSYQQTKKKRCYKKYYDENKEQKQEAARKYYVDNKAKITERHKEYLQTTKGRKVMKNAHKKRRKALAENVGVPYSREIVIDRDSCFIGVDKPLCWICGQVIEDISGKALHLDHVISVNNGGLDCFANIACTHSSCNLTKEKDDRKLDFAAVEVIQKRAEDYMDKYPEKFQEASED